MNVFVIIALAGLVALAWLWHKKPVLKGAPARAWPASRGNTGAKPSSPSLWTVAARTVGGQARRPPNTPANKE